MFVLAIGDPFRENFELYGPFNDRDEINDYLENRNDYSLPWFIAPLEKP